MMSSVETAENRLLTALPDKDLRLIQPHLVAVRLQRGASLHMQGDAVAHLYFPAGCVISVGGMLSDGVTVEVAVVGREGVAGINAVFGDHPARHWTRALVPGAALRLRASALRAAFLQSAAVQKSLLDYYRQLITQVSQRAVCNGQHTVIQRLCCWLLMVRDRLGADELPLTQEEIASRLGARRAGVTQAARALLSRRLINYRRGHIKILRREGVEEMACECYLIHREELGGAENAAARAPFQPRRAPAAVARLREAETAPLSSCAAPKGGCDVETGGSEEEAASSDSSPSPARTRAAGGA